MKAQVGLGKCKDTQDPHCSHIQIMDVEKDSDQELVLWFPLICQYVRFNCYWNVLQYKINN